MFFFLVLMFSFTSFVLSLIDFPKYERYLLPLQWAKAKPVRLKDNVWVGGYMREEKLIEFLKERRIRVVVIMLDRDMFHEGAIVERERSFLKRKGFRVYFVQFKPFMETENSVEKLSKILKRHRREGIYFHSYLGRVRTRIVRRLVGAH